MKVNGQLEVAQLEQIASVAPTPAPTGRIYMNVTNPLAAVPMVFNGTAWIPLLTGQITPTIVQNSGKAVTVNWANGFYQQVILTDNCLISFSNPQIGVQHTLLVTQAPNANVTSPALPITYKYMFNMPDQDCRRQNYQPTGCLQPSTSQVWSWFYQTGIKPGYATIPSPYTLANIAAVSAPLSSTISPDGKKALTVGTTTPFSSPFDLFDKAQKPSAVRANYLAPVAGVGAATGIDWSPDGDLLFMSSTTTPFLQMYVLDRQTPAVSFNPTALAGGAQCVAVNPQGSFVAAGHATSPFMSILPFTTAAFGTKLGNPVVLPAAQVNAIAWSPFGDFITVGSQTTPFIQTYPFTPFAGGGSIGAVVANPASLPAGGPSAPGGGTSGKQIAWRPQGDFIAFVSTVSPQLFIVAFNRATGTYGAVQTLAVTPTINCVAWTPDGQYLVLGMTATPFFSVYDFSTSALVGPISLDGNGPAAAVNDVTVHPSGEYVFIALTATPFAATQVLPTKVRNYLRIND